MELSILINLNEKRDRKNFCQAVAEAELYFEEQLMKGAAATCKICAQKLGIRFRTACRGG